MSDKELIQELRKMLKVSQEDRDMTIDELIEFLKNKEGE